VKDLLRRRVRDPLLRQLTQGVSPSKLALALALGVTLGAFPLLGTTTALCALAALAFRLNQPTIQVANYVAYPLQLGLVIPFFRVGARIVGVPPVALSIGELRAALARDPSSVVETVGAAAVGAVAAWVIVAPVSIALLYVVLRPVLAHVAARRARGGGAPDGR
jgi:uncharacterized protein (DUF2062 family)